VKVIQRPTGFCALAEDAVAITQEQMSRFGELRFPPTAIEEGHLELFLEILNLKTDGRLRDIEAVGSLLEASLTDDRSQNAELIKGERQISHRDAPVGKTEI
jgi:hypothetical protein